MLFDLNYWKSRANNDSRKSEIIENKIHEDHNSELSLLTDSERVLQGRQITQSFIIAQQFLKDLECSIHLFVGREYSDCIFDVYIVNEEESLGYKSIDKIKKCIQQIMIEGKTEEVFNISIKWYKYISKIFPSFPGEKIDELKYLITTPFLRDSGCVETRDREFLINSCNLKTDNWFQVVRLLLISELSIGNLE